MTLATPIFPATDDEIRRNELAAFLRSRRERITPESVGMISSQVRELSPMPWMSRSGGPAPATRKARR